MTPLEKLIRNKICDNGSIAIAEYIALASSHREFGYYNSYFAFLSKSVPINFRNVEDFLFLSKKYQID